MRPKFTLGERVVGNQKKASFRDRTGVIVECLPRSSEYGVRFDDHPERVEYVISSWLQSRPLESESDRQFQI